MLSAKRRISLIILTVFWGYPSLCQSETHAPDTIPQYASGASNADVASTQDYHNAGASMSPGPLHAVDKNAEADLSKQEDVEGLDDLEDVEGVDELEDVEGVDELEDTKEPDKQKDAEGLDRQDNKEEFAEQMPTETLNKKGETQGVNEVSEMETTADSSTVHTSPESSVDGSSLDELEDRTRGFEKEQGSQVAGEEKGTPLMEEAKGIPPKERVVAALPKPADNAKGKKRLRGEEPKRRAKKAKVAPKALRLREMEVVPSNTNSAFDLRLEEGHSEAWTPPASTLDAMNGPRRIRKPLKDRAKAYVPNAAKLQELSSRSGHLVLSGVATARDATSLLYPIFRRGGSDMLTVVVPPELVQSLRLSQGLLRLGGKVSKHIRRNKALRRRKTTQEEE